MKFLLKNNVSLFVLVLFFMLLSCSKPVSKTTPTCDGTASTYNSNIKSIIDNNCTNAGCHPNFSSYAGIKYVLGDGQFNSHVLMNQDMPRNGKLSTDELNKIQCWADAGYPEK